MKVTVLKRKEDKFTPVTLDIKVVIESSSEMADIRLEFQEGAFQDLITHHSAILFDLLVGIREKLSR